MDDQLGDLIRGQQFAMAARMTGLRASLAASGWRSRARRGRGRIRGGRTGGVARMLLELGLEVRDLGLELLELREQREQNRSDGGGVASQSAEEMPRGGASSLMGQA
jgi:hypothetical protein